jgi:hypothetical protein
MLKRRVEEPQRIVGDPLKSCCSSEAGGGRAMELLVPGRYYAVLGLVRK